MLIPDYKNTLTLTHFGRRSGEPFQVTIWFTNIDDELWIGSLDVSRSWVKNLRANGRAQVDFGDGPEDVIPEFLEGEEDRERYRRAVQDKYPVLSRILAFFVSGKTRAQFRLHPAMRTKPSKKDD